MDFLYSRHRLNVATSRARGVAILVASPDLLRVRARTPAQMRLANAFCRFVERADDPRWAIGIDGVAETNPPPEPGPPVVEHLTLGLDEPGAG